VMVNPGCWRGDAPAAIEALKAIDRFAKPKSVFITLENKDEGPSANYPRAPWEVIVEVIHATGLWANPDVGNFPDNEAEPPVCGALYPLSSGSSHCHYNRRNTARPKPSGFQRRLATRALLHRV